MVDIKRAVDIGGGGLNGVGQEVRKGNCVGVFEGVE